MRVVSTTQAETLFYHIVSAISVYSGSGDQIFLYGIKYFCVVRLTVTCALSERRVTTAGRDHWAMLCGTPATGLLVSALRTLPPPGTLQLLLILTPAVLSSQIQGSNNN